MQKSRSAQRQPITFALLGSFVALAGCASSATQVDLPSGQAAYQVIQGPSVPAPTEYLLAAQDVVNLKVLNEPDISDAQLRVDDYGNVQVPLIGQIKAAGRPVPEVSEEVRQRLAASYIRSPRVSISVVEPAKRTVTVEGEVKTPGVYEIDRSFTLLSALARAESTTTVAKLDEVIIFRTVNGQRMAAKFNLRDIRGGAAPDPTIVNGDVVVVASSGNRVLVDHLEKLVAPVVTGLFYLIR